MVSDKLALGLKNEKETTQTGEIFVHVATLPRSVVHAKKILEDCPPGPHLRRWPAYGEQRRSGLFTSVTKNNGFLPRLAGGRLRRTFPTWHASAFHTLL
jgi:hypothetical protein